MQSTKWRCLTCRAGREHIPDFDGLIGYDNTIDEQFKKIAFLLEGRRCKSVSDTSAEVLAMGSQPHGIVPPGRVASEVTLLPLQCQQPSFQITAPAFELGERQHASEISVGQSVDLLGDSGMAAPKVCSSRLQFLRQPIATASTFQGGGDHVGGGDYLT